MVVVVFGFVLALHEGEGVHDVAGGMAGGIHHHPLKGALPHVLPAVGVICFSIRVRSREFILGCA